MWIGKSVIFTDFLCYLNRPLTVKAYDVRHRNNLTEDNPMCDAIGRVLEATRIHTTNGVSCVWETAKGGYNFVGRGIENLTNKALPPTAARVVQKIYYGLLISLGNLFLPSYVQIPIVAGYFIVHIAHDIANKADGSLPFSSGTYENIYTGLGSAFLYRAANETYEIARQQKGANVFSLSIYLLAASLFISRLAFLRNPGFAPNGGPSNSGTGEPRIVYAGSAGAQQKIVS